MGHSTSSCRAWCDRIAMYGNDYYGGTEYASTRQGLNLSRIVEKAIDKVVLFTKNVMIRMITAMRRSTMTIKNDKGLVTSAQKKSVLITKNDKINI